MKSLVLLWLAILLVVAMWRAPSVESAMLFKSPVPPAQTFTSSTKVPIDLFVFIPCALGGVGEVVSMAGNLHVLFHFTSDASGGFHIKSHFQPQGVSGTGASSGAKYQATGVTQDQFNVSGLPFNYTFINNFKIIGQGPGNNFRVHQTFHITVNAKGELTAFVDNFKVDCK